MINRKLEELSYFRKNKLEFVLAHNPNGTNVFPKVTEG